MAYSKLILVLKQLLATLEAAYGTLTLKCLVAKDSDDISWELVLYAPWFDPNRRKRTSLVHDAVVSKLDASVILDFSGVTVYNESNDAVKTLLGIKTNCAGKLIVEGETIYQVNLPWAKMVIMLD